MKKSAVVLFVLSFALFSCKKYPEMTLEEIEEYRASSGAVIFENTVSKPWNGEKFVAGSTGGIWYDTISADPKTFNAYIGERDGSSAGIIGTTADCLVDYNPVKREWIPRLASFKIETDEKKGTLTVHYTLRDDVFWTYYGSDKKIPVTSDDVIFWYNEISGDEALQSSGYGGQWVMMSDGSEKRVEIVKVSEKSFDFVFPRIVADPLLSTNMTVNPGFLYKEAKDKEGIEGIKKLFSINCDPKTLPSCGMWYITDYIPGQRIILKRNPNYWEKDEMGLSIPYPEERILQIVSDQNTNYLLFTQGKQETYSPQPEEVDAVIKNQKQDYTVFNEDGSISAQLWSFNQNPKNADQNFYKWFTKKEFRQAMSCILNRDRIISQTFRGLAQPKYDFFPSANPMYNEKITLKYRYNLSEAETLLEKIGMKKRSDGFMYDSYGNKVEFNLTIPSGVATTSDISQIISDEASKIGITINVRQTDFQKVIEMLTSTFDWHTVIIGLGSNFFPSHGSNVWPTSGNLHLWYPCQEKPATDWEARVDWLYNEGCYTNDREEAKKLWDEYQEILLEQLPVIYLCRPQRFFAIRNKWDFTNFYYDNINGALTTHVYLSK